MHFGIFTFIFNKKNAYLLLYHYFMSWSPQQLGFSTSYDEFNFFFLFTLLSVILSQLFPFFNRPLPWGRHDFASNDNLSTTNSPYVIKFIFGSLIMMLYKT
jgi:hypothetical protein